MPEIDDATCRTTAALEAHADAPLYRAKGRGRDACELDE
jgi:PleD family two-component response regulator